ncbi:hypothetical protein TWF694_005071 [Orbilia ellipsospora]|uniref:Uncharacterized protein n=1 Tax=Orbilia ellipsospora TaxID=2528407 RepID=A0AAV9WVS8_9PEZI
MLFPVVAVLSLAGSALALPAVAAPACTATVHVIPSMTGLSPTETVYRRTVTAVNRVECAADNCAIRTVYMPMGPGPVVPAKTATVTLDATTVQDYKCKATAKCTTVVNVAQQFDLSPTETVYANTVAAERTIECNGCEIRTTHIFMGHGPVVQKTTTITLPAKTEVAFKCAATA